MKNRRFIKGVRYICLMISVWDNPEEITITLLTITVTAMFSKNMELLFVLLFLGAVSAKTCERKVGELKVDIHSCTECMWLPNTCQFCEDNANDGLAKGCITKDESCGAKKSPQNSPLDKSKDQGLSQQNQIKPQKGQVAH